MCEVFFRVNSINKNEDPKKRLELQFKLVDDCDVTENAIHNNNFSFQIGSEKWTVSASKSEKQRQFNKNSGYYWYIKGAFFEPAKLRKYKNLTTDTMHYSYDFIAELIKCYSISENKEYRGYFSTKDNLMILACEVID
ncbi:hypothetical protein [Aliivibrio fischeri]|uniref:hypothetical protein n=1 Tax=Aliivibrio fischeri TaxID=668 RepID=UPI00354FB7D5